MEEEEGRVVHRSKEGGGRNARRMKENVRWRDECAKEEEEEKE